jgi:FkbM family methyltransferase
MDILRKTVQKLFEIAGLRLLWLRNAPRGTESRIFKDVRTFLDKKSEPVIMLDVGANFGNVSAEMLQIFDEMPIHSFEPSPEVFASLQRRYAGHARVICHQLALSSAPGTLPFQARPDEPGLARLAEKETESTVLVRVETVDNFLETQKNPLVALMKTDTEGFEMEVFEGAEKALKAGRILSILVECAPGEGTHRHVPVQRISDYLGTFAYKLFGLYDFGYQPTGTTHFCNALFKHKSLSEIH